MSDPAVLVPPSADHFNAIMALVGTVMTAFFAYLTLRLNTVHTAVKEQLTTALDVISTGNSMIAQQRTYIETLRSALGEAGVRQPLPPPGPVPAPLPLPLEPPRKP